MLGSFGIVGAAMSAGSMLKKIQVRRQTFAIVCKMLRMHNIIYFSILKCPQTIGTWQAV